MKVSNNNPAGWVTGVVTLVVLIVTLMSMAIIGSLVGLSHKAKSRFWGSVHAGFNSLLAMLSENQHTMCRSQGAERGFGLVC